MRRLRRLRPGARWSITVRCAGATFRLKPDEERSGLVGYWLARAQQRHPGIAIVSACQMSSHLHVEIIDRRSELSSFMGYFLKNLSTAINYIDHRRGPSFERRFSALEIVDDTALVERVAYTVTNPIEAGIVRTHSEWPGVCLFAGREVQRHNYRRFRNVAHESAIVSAERTGAEVYRDDFWDEATLELEPVPELDVAAVERTIEEREANIRSARRQAGLGWLGAQRAQDADPFAQTSSPKRRRMPLCHASTRELWLAFRDEWRAFTGRYRLSSAALRAGVMTAQFPAYSFRPATATFPVPG